MYCYCCSGKLFKDCCQPLLEGHVKAANGSALMRARYSAYCLKNIEYIFATYHPDQHFSNTRTQIAEFAFSVHFVNLIITSCSDPINKDDATTCQVSFIAKYINGNKLETLMEQSRFVWVEGRWYYYDGDVAPSSADTIGRNDRCPCCSGKKFKQCNMHLISGTAAINHK
jgi:SEC-C motif-containing protein